MWISGDTKAVEGIADFEIVFRIPCRAISDRALSFFYENEFKNSRTKFSDTSSVHYQLKECNILWIMDGFDEATPEFKGFLENILKDLPENHKVVITTRPSSSTDLLHIKEMSEKQKCELSLEKFNENQIKDVARKYNINSSKFNHYYNQLQVEEKRFLENPLNLNLALELWSPTNNVPLKDLNTHKLYELVFEGQLSQLVKRLKGRTVFDERELTLSAKNWFSQSLCRIAAESLLCEHFELRLCNFHSYQLEDHARASQLIPKDCLSSFLDVEASFWELSCHFKHVIQKEALASIFIRSCSDKELEILCTSIVHFMDFKTLIVITLVHYDLPGIFLKLVACLYKNKKLCTEFEFLEVLEYNNKSVFNKVKDVIISTEREINIGKLECAAQLMHIAPLLLPEVKKINFSVEIFASIFYDYSLPFRVEDHWEEVIKKYKDNVNITLLYEFWMDKIEDINGARRICCSKDYPIFCVNCIDTRCYNASMTLNMYGGDPEYFLNFLIDIADNFHELRLRFNFEHYNGINEVVLNSTLLSKFISRAILEEMHIEINCLQEFHMQILNAVQLKFLSINMKNADNNSCQHFFERANLEMQNDLERVLFFISTGFQLKLLYKTISHRIACKTTVWISKAIAVEDVPKPEGKTFLAIRNSHSSSFINYETYNVLKKLTTHLT